MSKADFLKMLEGFREEVEGMTKILEGAAKLRELEEKGVIEGRTE